MVCPCCCAGACPNGDECTTGCACVNGQCVPITGGACCLPDGTCTDEYDTQEECEACETTRTCSEELFLEDTSQPCPEGWDGWEGFCFRNRAVESCDECEGFCEEITEGACGTWNPGVACSDYANPDYTMTVSWCGLEFVFDSQSIPQGELIDYSDTGSGATRVVKRISTCNSNEFGLIGPSWLWKGCALVGTICAVVFDFRNRGPDTPESQRSMIFSIFVDKDGVATVVRTQDSFSGGPPLTDLCGEEPVITFVFVNPLP